MGELLGNVDSRLVPDLSRQSPGVTLKNDTEHGTVL